MTTPIRALRFLLPWLGAAACAWLPAFAAGADLPGNSVYQLRPPLTDQNGRPFDLASARGQPVLVSMFYTSCQMTCPMIISTIQQTVKALAPAERERVALRGQRLDESKPGSGLGLSIVVELASLYGGVLTLGTAPIGGLRAELALPAG